MPNPTPLSSLSPKLPSRRSILQAMAVGAGAAAAESFGPLHAAGAMDPVSARIQADLARHAGFGVKRSGTPGDLMTAEWVAGRLRTAGYKIEQRDFEAPFLVQRSAQISASGMMADVYPQPPSMTTGSRGITARLALIRTSADAAGTQGKIALLVLPPGRYAALGRGTAGIGAVVWAAIKAGAAGVVIVTNGPSGEAEMLNAPDEMVMPIPVAILAPKSSKPFEEAAADGAEATLVIDADATHRNSKNVIGRLERGNRWIVISTPRSGWFNCVGERGTGTSVFLELAEWAVSRFPQHSIHLMNTGGHEYYFMGSHRVLHLAPPAQSTDVWAHIGATLAARDAVDSGGRLKMLDTVDPDRSVLATDAMNAAVLEGFRGIPELEHAKPVRKEAGELSAFTDLGFQRCFAVLGVHSWFHTIEDTLERVDGRLVTPVLEAHKRTMERVVDEA